MKLEVSVQQVPFEVGRDGRDQASAGSALFTQEQVSEMQLPGVGQTCLDRVLDAATLASVVDDGEFDSVGASRGGDRTEIGLGLGLRPHRHRHLGLDLGGDDLGARVDDRIGQRQLSTRIL